MAGTALLDLVAEKLLKHEDYARKAKDYISRKDAWKSVRKANNRNMRAVGRGEQAPFVKDYPDFKKDSQIEKHIKSVDKRNAEVDLNNREYLKHMDESIRGKRNYDEFENNEGKLRDSYRKQWRDLIDKRGNLYTKFLNETGFGRMPERIDRIIEAGMLDGKDIKTISKDFEELKRLDDEIGVMSKNINELQNPYEKYRWRDEDPYLAFLGTEPHSLKTPYIQPTASNVNYITRYHTTNGLNVPSIMKSGLRTDKGGTGYGEVLVNGWRGFDPTDLNEVYTSVEHPFGRQPGLGYIPAFDEVTLELKIPKKEYKKLSRNDTNPEIDFDFRNGSYSNDPDDFVNSDRSLSTVQHGGRTDIFSENLKPEWISKVFTEDAESGMTPEEFVKNFSPDKIDDWLENIERVGAYKPDFENGYDEWVESFFDRFNEKQRKMKAKHGEF